MAEQRIQETIEYLTQILTGWDGTEQRMALRTEPRRKVSFRYTGMTAKQSTFLRSLSNCLVTNKIEMYMWQHARLLPHDATAGEQALVQLDARDMWGYRDCSGFMITKAFGESEKHELVSIDATGLLTASDKFTIGYEAGSVTVVPMFYGILDQEDSYTDASSNVADMCINVEVMPSAADVAIPQYVNEYNYPKLSFPESTNADKKYKEHELFLMPPSWAQELSTSYSKNVNRLDNETGYFRVDVKSKTTTMTRSYNYVTTSKDQIQFLERFFYRCRGQWKSFYMPTWTNDIQLKVDARKGAKELYGRFQYYYNFFDGNKRRRTIIIFFYDGTIDIIELAGFALSDNHDRCKIFLKSNLTRALKRNDIRMISFLCLVRHNSDTMTIDYETHESASVTFEVTEVDG